MADAYNILAQQAQQTTQVFNAINANTTRAFEARRSALAAQANLALNVSQQLEQSRMNDMRAVETAQMMEIRGKEMEMREIQFNAEQKLAPLKMAYEEGRMKTALLQNTRASVEPFLNDLKQDISAAIFESPELAESAALNYDAIANSVASDLIQNPNLNVAQSIEMKKKQYRDWLLNEKTVRQQSGKMQSFDTEKNDIGKVTKIYESFGGSSVEFSKKHNPEYQKRLASAKTLMEITGEIDPDVFSVMDEADQIDLTNKLAAKKKFEQMNKTAIQLRQTLADMRRDDNVSPELLAGQETELKRIEAAMIKELNILNPQENALSAGNPLDSIINSVTQEAQQKASLKEREINRPESMSKTTLNTEEAKLERVKDLPLPEKVAGYLDSYKGIYPTSFDAGDFKDSDVEKLAKNDAFMEVAIAASTSKIDQILTERSNARFGAGFDPAKNDQLTKELAEHPTPEELQAYKSGDMTKAEESKLIKKLYKILPDALYLFASKQAN